MRKWIVFGWILAATLVSAHVTVAQDAVKPAEGTKTEAAARYYHLRFVIEELNADGKATNSRTYTSTVSTARDEFASIRSGSRIPIVTSATGTDEKASVTQFQYIDIGANIDARHARALGDELALNVTAEITSMAAALDPRLHQPIIRQNKWQAVVLVPVGKPAVIFTSDSLDSKGSMQMVLTATPAQ